MVTLFLYLLSPGFVVPLLSNLDLNNVILASYKFIYDTTDALSYESSKSLLSLLLLLMSSLLS